MAKQITNGHLNFVQEAKEAFETDPGLYTWRNAEETFIALRYGMDRDCVLVYELGECIANFVQQTPPAPTPRQEVMNFAYDMEKQLKANDHKGGWSDEHWADLTHWIGKNLDILRAELMKSAHDNRDKHEITKRCANIANFAMMVADNEGEHL